MALVTITGSHTPSYPHYGLELASFEAGEAIYGGYACVIKSDGKAYAAGTAVVTGTTQVSFDGFSTRDYASGDRLTLVGQGSVLPIDANAGLTIGKELYLSATAGFLSDAKIAGSDTPVAKAVSTTSVRVLR